MNLNRIAKVINRNLNERTSLNSIAAKIASNLRKDANVQEAAEKVEYELMKPGTRALLLVNSEITSMDPKKGVRGVTDENLEVEVTPGATGVKVVLFLKRMDISDLDRKLNLLKKNTELFLNARLPDISCDVSVSIDS